MSGDHAKAGPQHHKAFSVVFFCRNTGWLGGEPAAPLSAPPVRRSQSKKHSLGLSVVGTQQPMPVCHS